MIEASDMSAEERLAKIKEQTRLRVQRHYGANREEINRLRREKRKATKENEKVSEPATVPVKARRLHVSDSVLPQTVRESAPVVVAPVAPVVASVADSAPVIVKKPRMRVKRPVLATAFKKIMTVEQADAIISESAAITSDESRKIYRRHLHTVVEILKCPELIMCFQNAKQVIEALNDARQKRDTSKGYSINSKKSYVQMILKLSDVLSIPLSTETKEQYKDAFEALKLDSKGETKERQDEAKKEAEESKEKAMTFDTYLPKIKEHYGEDSKEYIVASLYSLHGFRDDLQLRLVREFDDKPDNQYRIFRVVNRKPVWSEIRLNRYKTEKAYGSKDIKVPKDLMVTISRYTTKNNIKLGDYLFGDKPLSRFVSDMNKKIGLNLSINKLRELHVSPVIDGMSSADRVELAKKMNHSPATSEHYRAKKKA